MNRGWPAPRQSTGSVSLRPAVGQANASQADLLGLTVSVSVSPSQYLIIEVLRRPIEFTQYLSIRYTERLAGAGIEPSVGSVGDSYDCEPNR